MEKLDLLNLRSEELNNFITGLGEKPFHSKQIAKWLYRKGVTEFDEMTDLSKDLRARLKDIATVTNLIPSDELVSSDGTKKYLFTLKDGARIESVMIPDEKRKTLCLSTQVGCLMGCTFCLTGTLSKVRNLSISEIVGQYMAVNSLNDFGLTNIVFMGMGEPLDNLHSTLGAIDILTNPNLMGLSPRRITVSTSGLVPQLKELNKLTPVNISVSLNASNDETRDEIMPINKKYPLKTLLGACRELRIPWRSKLTFEYVLLDNVNDARKNAFELLSLLKGMKCMINLIPFNEADPLPYKTPDMKKVFEFQNLLVSGGIHTRIRKSRGRDIMGACGQLAAGYGGSERKRPAGRTSGAGATALSTAT